MNTNEIKNLIRTIPDYPKTGIMFRDITTLIKSDEGFKATIDIFYERYKHQNIDKIVGIESRGFIFGSALAYALGKGFIPMRKPGKLPAEVISEEYDLEYGKDKIEIHQDSLSKGDKVIIIDDLLATGGTALAAKKLVTKLEAEILEFAFVVELPELKGKKKLEGINIFSIVQFEGE